jgi:ribose 5-phosphate isomerase B
MKIALASDHAGFVVKAHIKEYLTQKGYAIKDFGAFNEESCDYPDYAHPMANSVSEGETALGFSFCGSGNGINMAANKHNGIRSALCWQPAIARLARQHNNANICAIPARFVSAEEAEKIVDAFLSSDFEGGRHQQRIEKIPLK